MGAYYDGMNNKSYIGPDNTILTLYQCCGDPGIEKALAKPTNRKSSAIVPNLAGDSKRASVIEMMN